MGLIHVLDKLTIDQIAAGEVVERPSSVVKELVENAMDAGAVSVTVEIRNGGIDLIRVTDNGFGMAKEDVPVAFLRHATSKIQDASDLTRIGSLGFRGEALSSIASVSRLELITKRPGDLTATDYEIHGGEEISLSEIGAPDGSTFLVQDLFYNTPARRKFLKTPMTEASYIADLLEHMALSRPDVSIRLINNGNVRLTSSGNGKVKDLVYTIYGRETANLLLPVSEEKEGIRIDGFIGKPELAKGNRGFESFFVNGRYVHSVLIQKALEEAYKPYLMQHRYPFTVLYLTIPAEEFDVNVHPTKMELRFRQEPLIFDTVMKSISAVLKGKELIPETSLTDAEKPAASREEQPRYTAPEPFEEERMKQLNRPEPAHTQVHNESKPGITYNNEAYGKETAPITVSEPQTPYLPGARPFPDNTQKKPEFDTLSDTKPLPSGKKSDVEPLFSRENSDREHTPVQKDSGMKKPVQADLFKDHFLSEEGLRKSRIIGQLFKTYWLIEYDEKLYMMDQHAAHEKVLYERKMQEFRERKMSSQLISPPVVVTLSASEDLVLNRYMEAFSDFGYEISAFGGREYAISAIPADLYGVDVKDFFQEVLSDMGSDVGERNHEMILHRIATASCKAAVKGNQLLTEKEAEVLLQELLSLENPYMCPHGRPTLIAMTKSEIEKKFKRIV